MLGQLLQLGLCVLGSNPSTPSSDLEFSPIVNVSQSDRPSQVPSLAMAGGAIYVAWLETNKRNFFDIRFSRSLDSGATFSTPINVSKQPDLYGFFLDPNIAANKWGGVFITWPGNPPGLYLAYSLDGGEHFSAPMLISGAQGGGALPSVACDRLGSIHVAWTGPGVTQNNGIYYTRSDDFRQFWTDQTSRRGRVLPRFSEPIHIHDGCRSRLAGRANGGVYAMLEADIPGPAGERFDVFLTRSIDGITFDPLLNVSYSADMSVRGSLTSDDHGNIFVAWMELSLNPYNWEVYVSALRDGDSSAPAYVNVSEYPAWNDVTTLDRAITVDRFGIVSVGWIRSAIDPGSFVRRSLDGAKTFCPPQLVPEYDSVNSRAALEIGSDEAGRVGFAWYQADDSGNIEIFFTLGTPK